MPRNIGVGLFASIFKATFPLLPTEEEGRLHDPVLRENFIESVFVYKRWRDLCTQFSTGLLVEFHTRHKLLLRAHSEERYREMGTAYCQSRHSGRAADKREVFEPAYDRNEAETDYKKNTSTFSCI